METIKEKRQVKGYILAELLVLCLLAVVVRSAAAEDLATTFERPPDSARMWTWWFWLGDKVDRQSITADLEALKAQGIAGVHVTSISGPGVPGKGPNYMSPEWLELWRHTLREAERLGLGVSAMLCSGWNAGGPWIKPEQACKKHVYSKLDLKGPQRFKGKLPMPLADARLYRDLAVHAFPSLPEVVKVTASSSHPSYPARQACDGNGATFWVSNGEKPMEGPSKEKPEWLLVDLGTQRLIRTLVVRQRPGYGPRDMELQTSEDGAAFSTVRAMTMEREGHAGFFLPNRSFRFISLNITSSYSPQNENVQVCEILADGVSLGQPNGGLLAMKNMQAMPGGYQPTREVNDDPLRPLPSGLPIIDRAAMFDLTARCTADGELEWEVPAGEWTVLRSGYTLTGHTTTWSSPTGIGFEADPLDRDAMGHHFAKAGAPLVEVAGPLAGKLFRSVTIDSWEIYNPNWTAGLVEAFKKGRGYDPRPFLPALADYVIGRGELTDRFLYDYRLTVGDLVAEHYFGRLTELARERGLLNQSEAGGVCSPVTMAMDCLKNLGRCDIPMGEFWQDGLWTEGNQNKNTKQTASAAHLYGKRIAAAEAFTSFMHWVDSPASLKPTADRAFCEGINHFFIFSSATRSGEGLPGTEFAAGTHFNRKVTWWSHSRGFNDYVARCSHLLQQGLFVADVLFYNGDGCPNFVGPKQVHPAVGTGYDYDVCNTEIILTRLAVRDGRIVLPDGMSYRVLVLPERTAMPVEVLAKLKALVADGMTLVGPKPEKAPGLKDYPQCDQQVKALADELWGACDGKTVTERAFGKGRVVWGKTVREVLGAAGVKSDFACTEAQPGAFLDWIHRSMEGAEIYFIANRLNRRETATCTFRVSGKQPEIWDPVTGMQRDAAVFSQDNGSTLVRLELPAYGSLFVIFRKSQVASAKSEIKNLPVRKPVMELTGPWTVTFDPKRGGPEKPVLFDKLTDWTEQSDLGIKYYSGAATYRKTFDFKSEISNLKSKIHLDLGVVHNIAQVRLNGHDLGTVWCAPWQVEITQAVKPGNNDLEIEIVNLWPNRLIGDGKLPSEKRFTQTNIDTYYKGEHKLLPSGLLGPVRLMVVNAAAAVEAPFSFSLPAGPRFTEAQKAEQVQAGATVLPRVLTAFSNGLDAVHIPPGDYRFKKEQWGRDGVEHPLAFKGLRRDRAHPFTIDATGATFWFDLPDNQAPQAHFAVGFKACANLIFRGATLDRGTRGHVEGRITALDRINNRIEIELSPGVTVPATFNGKLEQRVLPFKADGRFCAPLYALQSGGLHLKYTDIRPSLTSNCYFVVMEKTSLLDRINDATWRKTYGDLGTLDVGDGLSCIYTTTSSIELIRCERMTLEGLKVYIPKSCGSEWGGEGGHLWKDCYFGPRPGTSQWQGGEGFMFNATRHGTTLDGVVMRHTADDLANFHGYWGHIESLEGRRVTFVRSGEFDRLLGQDLAPGDRLLFRDRNTGHPIGESRVVRTDGNVVSTDGPVMAFTNAIVQFPDHECAGWKVLRCDFRDNYQRLLIQSGPGIIADSVFVRQGNSVEINSVFPYVEGGVAHDITITGNRFEDVNPQPGGAAISMHTHTYNGGSPTFSNIVITGNTFVRPGRAAIRLNNFQGGLIASNRFEQTATPPVELKRCSGISVVESPTNSPSPRVEALSHNHKEQP